MVNPGATSISNAQARRIALAAQGFADRPHAQPTMATLTRTVRRTGLLQIDSVNVLQRAHFMPLFSRMGPYDVGLLERASARAPRRLVEYWAHCAAYMPVDLWPAMQYRMDSYRARGHEWLGEPDRAQAKALLREVRDGGAATARDLDDGLPRRKDNWGWNWSATKRTLEYLFFAGELSVARRNSQFERVYDVPERVVPRHILDLPTPSVADAARELLRRAAIAHGIGTENCLRDYFRMQGCKAFGAHIKSAIGELVDDGELIPVGIAGWDRPAYLHRDARIPRRITGRALLSPFDPMVWERERTKHLFGFDYRIEIYVPAAKRRFGYYVLPFLLDDAIVARVDLKADRGSSVLLVHSSHAEPTAPDRTAYELAHALRLLADWLGLDEIRVLPAGDLAPQLAQQVAALPPRGGLNLGDPGVTANLDPPTDVLPRQCASEASAST